jgi:hypothetical protein
MLPPELRRGLLVRINILVENVIRLRAEWKGIIIYKTGEASRTIS